MIQSKQELDDWYSTADPWGYETNPDDRMRKSRVLAAIPSLEYGNTLDVGCGNGFVTRDLPGTEIIGTDISQKAIDWARQNARPHIQYMCASLFDIPALDLPTMDLIVITGVLYPQYIGASMRLVYVLIDKILKPGGILVSSHIFEWHKARFPYLTISREYFPYREYSQSLEVFCK